MSRPLVSIVKVEGDEIAATEQAIKLLGGMEKFVKKGSKVFIKPNLLGGGAPKSGVSTNPIVTVAVINALRKLTADISLIDSNYNVPSVEGAPIAIEPSLDRIYRRPNFDIYRDLGVKLINLSNDKTAVYKNPRLKVLGDHKLPSVLATADVIINIPVMKVHDITAVTLGMKNLYGLIPIPRVRAKLHKVIDEAICDLVQLFPPSLTVIDGTIGMEGGYSPCFGAPADANIIVAGSDIVATDSVAASLMGFDYRKITQKNPIALGEERSLGKARLSEIDVVGEKISDVRRPFDFDKNLPETLVKVFMERRWLTESDILHHFRGREDLVRRYLRNMILYYGPIREARGGYEYVDELFQKYFVCRACGKCGNWGIM
jgi:uncharacterized protein (DUF362 family)